MVQEGHQQDVSLNGGRV